MFSRSIAKEGGRGEEGEKKAEKSRAEHSSCQKQQVSVGRRPETKKALFLLVVKGKASLHHHVLYLS